MLFLAFLILVRLFHVVPITVKQDAFTLPTVGFRLTGAELRTKYTQSTFFCANECVRLNECLAYNYKHENGTCQLMATSDLSTAEPDDDFQIIRKKITCIDQPCLHGGTCQDEPTSVYDIRGYRCTCPCGRCGPNCEKLHFGQVENACIYLFNAGYQKVASQQECMSFCWDTQGCRSADYINSQGACWLNSVTGDEEPLTMDCDKWYPGVAYLFFNCTCDA
ncbi:hypothetical protein HNY73_010170 [Argiope bruennichi]|uniref:Apple domain-containing protein n=2 Tax=Argiope bruennichi TaxID=94029 RepID=A0A8T0F205_ARGBR|nr:hypothetical protein HNY73_010170 [Argiope bruennichi]